MPRLFLSLLLLLTSPASAVTMDWTFVGNPGNDCDPQYAGLACFGSVTREYHIGKYEVTNAQYTEFLNAKATADSLGLWNVSMNASPYGGISRTGSSGTYVYSATAGRANMPVNFVTFFDALRFANWMNNGQGSGSTETGAYTLLGGTATPSNGDSVTRNLGATIILPNEDEWYKAAYYSASGVYFDYPTGTDTATTCSAPTGTTNRANCNNSVANLTGAGSYTGAASPYGTFDQGGNVLEWTETIVTDGVLSNRVLRGGEFQHSSLDLHAGTKSHGHPTNAAGLYGFRLVMIPEPSTGLLVIVGLLGLAVRRRVNA